MCCSLVSVATCWSTTIVCLRRGYRMSPCEGVISTISGHSSCSPRLWAGGDRTRIWHSCRPYIEDPRSIRQWDSDEESPHCKACRARSPRKMDVPTVPMSPTSVSSRDLSLIIYDGRPAILPVSIRLADLVGDDVVVSVDLPIVIAPPGEDGVHQAGLTSTRDLELAIMSEFSSDTDPDLEDAICRFQPLQAAVSPLSTTSIVRVMTSPSRYPAPAVPVVPSAASSMRVSPAPIREEYSPGTLDVFPTYFPSTDISLYVPATSLVTPVQPGVRHLWITSSRVTVP